MGRSRWQWATVEEPWWPSSLPSPLVRRATAVSETDALSLTSVVALFTAMSDPRSVRRRRAHARPLGFSCKVEHCREEEKKYETQATERATEQACVILRGGARKIQGLQKRAKNDANEQNTKTRVYFYGVDGRMYIHTSYQVLAFYLLYQVTAFRK